MDLLAVDVSLVAVVCLCLALVWAFAKSEGFCPEGWGPGNLGACQKTYPELRCTCLSADGQLTFGPECSRYARDTITKALKS
jgi:hypothetical protein